jgi:hypothetical protein
VQDLQFLFYVWMGFVMSEFNKPTEPPIFKSQQEFYDYLRNGVIDEVTTEIQKMQGFGKDTISSFVIYIQGMKK